MLYHSTWLTWGLHQVLCLGIEGHDCTDTHLVQVDETCEVIAKTANTTVGLILENNPNVNKECTNIYDGEVSSYFDPMSSARLICV